MPSDNSGSGFVNPNNIQGLTDGSEVSTPQAMPKELAGAYAESVSANYGPYTNVNDSGLKAENFEDVDDDDSSDDDEAGKLERIFTHDEPPSEDLATQEQREEAKDRSYIEQLLGEEGESGFALSRFEGWLGKDVLLQGNIFLTKRYFLFYAHLPSATLETIKASPLAKKSKRNIGTSYYHRYWFVLRMGSFTWYRNPGDIYFPTGLLSLELMKSVSLNEKAPEKFVIKAANGKSYTFKADSRSAANEWVKAIQKEIFRAGNQNSEPLAVVRIPLQNIVHLRVVKPLDIVKLINMQVILEPAARNNQGPADNVLRYTFAFFGNTKAPRTIVERIAASTNDLENHRNLNFKYPNGLAELDFERSQFGEVSEAVYDTTPATQFRISDGTMATDREILYSSDSIAGGKFTLAPNRAPLYPDSPASSNVITPYSSNTHSASSSRVPTRPGSPSASSSVTASSSTSHKSSKIKILSSLNHKLNKLKVEDFKPDVSTFTNAAAFPVKKFSDKDSDATLDGEISDDDEDADSDYGDDDGKSKVTSKTATGKFYDDHYMPFTPQNFSRKLRFGNSDDIEASEGVDFDSVSDTGDLAKVNKWFRDHFGLDNTVNLMFEYICSIRKPGNNSTWDGKLFISSQFLCFQRRGGPGRAWRMVIPLRDIIHIKDQKLESNILEFEVAETAYSEFGFIFEQPAARRDAEEALRSTVKQVPENDPDVRRNTEAASQNLDEDSESRFIEYSLHSARLAAKEPTLASQLRHRIPPMLFDPKSSQYKEIFLQKPMKSMKFVMLMIGSRGDVQPYIALSQGLMEEGHKCCIVTHKEFKDWVESFGIEFKEVAGDPRELMEIMISHGSISYGFVREALAHFKNWLKELMSTAWTAVKAAEPDVFIESPSSMIGIHIAEALNIPYFRAFTMPWTRTKIYPQALIAPDQKRTGNYNAFTYVLYDRLVWFGISKYVNKWRKRSLKLPETDLDLLRQEDVPFLYCVSPTVLVPPIDQPDWIHTCGYWELRQDKKDKEKGADPEVQKFINIAREKKKPVVYIGFGSIIVTDPEAMTRTVVDATKQAGVYCILARGWSSRSTKNKDTEKKEKKPLNVEHIHEVDSVNHQWLFPRVDACVHHGGSGTTGASLRAGKPTIIKPFFGDQFFYGRRVEDLGIGFFLKKLTTAGLANALKECTTNKQLIRQAAVVGDQISHEHGVDEAILCIYRELGYADDVTKRRRKMTVEASKSGLLTPIKNLHPDGLFNLGKDDEESHSWFSLPKLGRREEQRRDRDSNDEVDVSV